MKRYFLAIIIIAITAMIFTSCTRRASTAKPADGDFSIFGEWRLEIDTFGNVYRYNADMDPAPYLSLIINDDNSMTAWAYETDIIGHIIKIDDYTYQFKVHTRSVMWNTETVDEIISLEYNPETRLLRYEDRGEVLYFIKGNPYESIASAATTDSELSILGEWQHIETSFDGMIWTYPTTSVLRILKNLENEVSVEADYAGWHVYYYGNWEKTDQYVYHIYAHSRLEIGTGNTTAINDTLVFTYDPATKRLGWLDLESMAIRYYEYGGHMALAKQAYDSIMRQNSVDIFFMGDGIPFNIDDYSVKKDIIQRGFEGDPDIYEYTLYIIQKNGHDIMNIFGEEIMVISDIVKTFENIGVNSTIEEFAGAYPDFGIFYTYVSNKYWLSTDRYQRIQFLLDGDDFTAEWDGSTIIELTVSDFKPNSKINKIRIYNDEWLFLH